MSKTYRKIAQHIVYSDKDFKEMKRKGEKVLKEMKHKMKDFEDIELDNFNVFIADDIADKINVHSKNTLEWNIKVHGVNIPKNVIENISENLIDGTFRSIAQNYIEALGSSIIESYSWAKDWFQEGRMGGWFIIKPDFSKLIDTIDELIKFVPDFESIVESEDEFSSWKHMIGEAEQNIIRIDKVKKEINSIKAELKTISGEVKKTLKDFVNIMESESFWKDEYPEYFEEEEK